MEQQVSPGNLLGEIARTVEQFKLPGLDMAPVLETAGKDIEALAEANRITLAGMHNLGRKQGEILFKTLQELQPLVQEARAAGHIAQTSAQLSDLVRNTLQAALGDLRHFAEVVSRPQAEAAGVVSERAQRSIDELRALLLPRRG
jgi:phasin family protein